MQVLNGTGVQSPLQPAKAKPERGRRQAHPCAGRERRPALRRGAVEPRRAALDPPAGPDLQRQRDGRRRGRLELRRDEHVVVRHQRADGPGPEAVARPAGEHAAGVGHGREGHDRAPAHDGAADACRSPRAPAGSPRDRIPEPVRSTATGTWRSANSAVAVASAVSERAQTPVEPAQAPRQPANSEPSAASGVSCTLVPQGRSCTHRGGQAVPPTASRTTPTPLPPVATDEAVRHLAVRADAIQAVDHDRVQAGAARELVADAVHRVDPVVAGAAVRAGRARRRRRACRRPRPRRARRCRRRRAGGRRRRRRAACRCRRRRRCGHDRRARRCGRRSPCPRGGRRAASRASRQRRRPPARGPARARPETRPGGSGETRPC